MKRRWLWIALALAATGAAWLSQQPADRFIPAIASAIEGGLGRKVEIRGPVLFSPLRMGFSLTDVVIHDDRRFGLEPLAYVDELQATVRLTALLRGRLEFDRLRLVDPSVNLAQNAGGWNFPALLDQALQTADGVAPPEVEVTGGRLNVRFGETKSVYYLWDANLTLEPGSRPGQLSLYFDGVPARTDRGQKGFGRLSARGTVDLGGERWVNLQAALERSAASELLLLFQNSGSSVEGFFSGSAKLQGPLDALQIDGSVRLHELERWGWIFGPGRGPAVEWTGVLNWGGQRLRLKTKPDDLPVGISVEGEQLLGPAVWRCAVSVREAPAEVLEHLAQEFGYALPGGTVLAGRLNGDVRYVTKDGFEGQLDLTDGALSLGSKEKAEVGPAAVRFAGWRAAMDPVVIRQGAELVRLEGAYQWPAGSGGTPGLSWSFSGPELDLGRAREWGMALPGRIQSGKWRGALRYEVGAGGWRGEGDLADADLEVEGVAAKVHLDSARVKLQGARFSVSRMAGRIDDTELRGDFDYDPDAPIDIQAQLQFGEVTAEALRKWLAPAMAREPGVLWRTLGIGAGTPPDWLESRRISATVQANSFRAGEQVAIGPVTAKVTREGSKLKIASIAGPARLRGQGELALVAAEGEPAGRIELENLPWRGGLADVTLDFEALEPAPKGKVRINARGVSLIGGERWMHGQAEGEFDVRPAEVRVRFTQIEIRPRAGDEAGTLRGTGQTLGDGTWEWDLASAQRSRKIAGPIVAGDWKEIP